MDNKERKPKEYDLVLGGNNPPSSDGLVLGGIEGVKRRLASNDINVKITALSDALKYESEGLDLVIRHLNDNSKHLQISAYKLLKNNPEPQARQVLASINHYQFFECLHTIEPSEGSFCNLTLVKNRQTIISYSYKREYGKKKGSPVYIQEWDLKTDKKLTEFLEYSFLAYIEQGIFSSDGKTVFLGGHRFKNSG
jgi:hypothetical protein